ncbi:trypsin domain-containing protein [Phthorimaea operculella]|nr:trypsin domain-containing protein [Phthorimaea operculella]
MLKENRGYLYVSATVVLQGNREHPRKCYAGGATNVAAQHVTQHMITNQMGKTDHHNNTLIPDEASSEKYEFEYNFINLPWGERTKKSKIGIILLLVAIFVVTFACVINCFLMHYRGHGPQHNKLKGAGLEPGTNCQMVRVEEHRYVARIHSLNTHELICVGAVVSETVVLANGACVKNRQVWLHVGNPTDARCKKGFMVDIVETIMHEGVIGKKLVLLVTKHSMSRCAKVVQFGNDEIHKSTSAFVIGRTSHGNSDRSMSRQPVQVVGTGTDCFCPGLPVKRQPNMICVKTIAHCPILAGDLLVQGGLLYGIASTSLFQQKQVAHACFADFKTLLQDLKENYYE